VNARKNNEEERSEEESPKMLAEEEEKQVFFENCFYSAFVCTGFLVTGRKNNPTNTTLHSPFCLARHPSHRYLEDLSHKRRREGEKRGRLNFTFFFLSESR
jgi:hypothetical protein